jgi:hypothetical protein
MPVVAGNKADRLPFKINQDTLTATEKVDVAYVPPSEQSEAGLPPPAPKEVAGLPDPVIAPRHWHDPHGQPPKQVSEVEQCRSDGLGPPLRKLNLAPPCDS